MRSIAVTCARNEADIIEPFVRHTLAFCDTAIVLDHGSTDATPEILRRLQEEGLSLHVVRDDTIGRLQVDHTNRLLRMAAEEFSADWILCLDVDEFIAGSTNKAFLPAEVDENTPCLKLRPRTYYCRPDDGREVLNPVERITRRLVREPESGDVAPFKIFVPGPLAKRPGARLAAGNHLLRIDGVEPPSRVLEEVWLAHFSLRTPGQYAVKLASKRLQAHRFISPHGDEGAHYEQAYARMVQSYSSFAANFLEERLSYLPPHDNHEVIADPLDYRGGPLRHTSPVNDLDNFTRQMLGLAETLAFTGSRANGNENARSDVTRLLNIEVSTPGTRGEARECDTGAAGRRQLEFPLAPCPGAESLRLRVACEPGMLEISRLSLVYPGAERVFDVEELRRDLRVVSDAAVIHSGVAYRVLISREPAVLALRNWRKNGDPLPSALRMEIRYDDHPDKSVLLHPAALNAMNRDAAAREISEEKLRLLQERVRYGFGDTIDFSDRGDAILYTRGDWANPEPWGTWTEGGEAVLKIRLTEIPKCAVTLNASVKALVNRGHCAVTAEVHVNGEKIADWKIDNAEFKQHRLKIPAGKITTPECLIAFKILDPRSPERLGIAPDKRLLGLGFGKMDLQC